MRTTLANTLDAALPDHVLERTVPVLTVSGHQPTWRDAIRDLQAERSSPVEIMILRWATHRGTFPNSGKRSWQPLVLAVPGDLRRFRRLFGGRWHGQAPLATWFTLVEGTEGDVVIGRDDAGWTWNGQTFDQRAEVAEAVLATIHLDPLIDALLAASVELRDEGLSAAAADLFAGNGASDEIRRETIAQVRAFVNALTDDVSVVAPKGDHAVAFSRC